MLPATEEWDRKRGGRGVNGQIVCLLLLQGDCADDADQADQSG